MPGSRRASGDELLEAMRSMRVDINDLQKEGITDESVGTTVRDSASNVAVSDASGVYARGGPHVNNQIRYRIAPKNLARTPDGLLGPDWDTDHSNVDSISVVARDYQAPYLWSSADWPYCATVRATASSSNDASIMFELRDKDGFSQDTDVFAEIYFYMTAGRFRLRMRPGSGVNTGYDDTLNEATRYAARTNDIRQAGWRFEVDWSLAQGETGVLYLAGIRAEAGQLGSRDRYLKLGASMIGRQNP